MEKGILTAEVEQMLAKALDKAIVLKGIWEALDGPAFLMLFRTVDDNLGDKIPVAVRDEIRGILSEVWMEKDPELAAQKATDLLAGIIVIPGIPDAYERLVLLGVLTIAMGLLAKINPDED